MKRHLLIYMLAGVFMASCSTTIERNTTAFGGGWGMSEKKESFRAKESKSDQALITEKKSLAAQKEIASEFEDQKLYVISTPPTKWETQNFKNDIYQSKAYKDLNVVEKTLVKKAANLIEHGMVKKPVRKTTKKDHSINTRPSQINNAGLTQEEMIIAVVLCILLGYIGMHRFYLGAISEDTTHYIVGIIQLFTLGGCGIWALIDLIRILTGNLGRNSNQF